MNQVSRRASAIVATVLAAGMTVLSSGSASGTPSDGVVASSVVQQAAGSTTISGQITDGSGQGWPLYARITVGGEVYYSEPSTGRYSISLAGGSSYDLVIEPVYPGYRTVRETVDLGGSDVVRDIAVPVDETTCAANGYAFTYAADFDNGALPAGWSVTDENGNGAGWSVDDPHNRGNRSGGTGKFAIADSNFYGAGNKPDTMLISPIVDLSDDDAPQIAFNQDFYYRSGEAGDVDLSVDGGATWTNLVQQTASTRGPRVTSIPIPQAAGKSEVQVRFHYYRANFDGWWELDNIVIGERTCDPTPGGAYLVGDVTDANTGASMDGVTVTAGAASTRTTRGAYWLFTKSAGAQDVTASGAHQYVAQTQRLDLEGVTHADFALTAGQLSVTSDKLDPSMELGDRHASGTVTITNTGTAPAQVRMGEGRRGFSLDQADGSTRTLNQIEQSRGAAPQRLDVPVTLAMRGTSTVAQPKETTAADGWTSLANYPQAIMDNRVVLLDGKVLSIGGTNGSTPTANVWSYDPATLTWTAAAPLPAPRSAMTVGLINGQIIASSGWGAGSIAATTSIYDPLTREWSSGADNPAPRAAAGEAVLDGRLFAVGGCTTGACTPISNTVVAYDPVADSWQTLADYPLSVAYPSCAGIDGHVVCTGGSTGDAGTSATYSYDPDEDEWTRIADAPSDSWGASYAAANDQLIVAGGVQGDVLSNAAFSYDPATREWSWLPNTNSARYRAGGACGFYKIGGAWASTNSDRTTEVLPGFDGCSTGEADAEWLALDTTAATLAPGDSVTVQVDMHSQVTQPGDYRGSIWFREDTPYAVSSVPVEMTVTPPRSWGKLAGVVRGTSCDGTTSALRHATVTVDSATSDWTFSTKPDGSYAYWIDKGFNPLTVYGAKDGYRPQVKTVRLKGGQASAVDFDLSETKC